MLDPTLIGRVAQALGTEEGHIEKDWHVVRALGVITTVEVDGVCPVFSGGTSLSKGWGIIKRFSEDIDFKVGVTAPNPSAMRTRRSTYRKQVLDVLTRTGYPLVGEPLIGNASQFVRASFTYGATFPAPPGMRPELKIEMTFGAPALVPKPRPLQSFLAQAAGHGPEVSTILCVDPVETSADKLSALAWRTHVRDRNAADDDPSIIRLLHDLAALADKTGGEAGFIDLARRVLANDSKRTKDQTVEGLDLLSRMLPTITADPIWRTEYEHFVREVTFGPDEERIGFDAAVAACQRLVEQVMRGAR